MLVAQKNGTQILPVRTERRVTRLALNFQDAGSITEEARQRNISALQEYMSILTEYRVGRISCGATGVVRRAENSSAVIEEIAAETGIRCRILSEQTEAILSAKGVLSALPETGGDLLTFDIGGGSTEFLLAVRNQGKDVPSTSRPIGAATLSEAHLRADPPGPDSVARAAISVRDGIMSAKEQIYQNVRNNGIIVDEKELRLVGTAGTISTLAAMYIKMERYIPYRVNGLTLTKDWLSSTIESLARMPLDQRRLIPGLEPGREDIILGGAVIVSEILRCFGRDRFTVTDAGLLEGLLLDLIERECGFGGGGEAGLRTVLTWRLQKG
jgi:exopolyphosphatase/guanosine-5'-triphosphate,3'-diphosphate pyrophosphatase